MREYTDGGIAHIFYLPHGYYSPALRTNRGLAHSDQPHDAISINRLAYYSCLLAIIVFCFFSERSQYNVCCIISSKTQNLNSYSKSYRHGRELFYYAYIILVRHVAFDTDSNI